jgi:hypothetical protein
MDDVGLLMEGKVGDSFVEKAFLVTTLAHDCRSIVGRIIEAIPINRWDVIPSIVLYWAVEL